MGQARAQAPSSPAHRPAPSPSPVPSALCAGFTSDLLNAWNPCSRDRGRRQRLLCGGSRGEGVCRHACTQTRVHPRRVHTDTRTETTVRQRPEWDAGGTTWGSTLPGGGGGVAVAVQACPSPPGRLTGDTERGGGGSKAAAAAVISPGSRCRGTAPRTACWGLCRPQL